MPIDPVDMIDNRYQLLRKLGQGGMGAVFQARDRLTGQLVALKQVALPGLAGTGSATVAVGSAPTTEGVGQTLALPPLATPQQRPQSHTPAAGPQSGPSRSPSGSGSVSHAYRLALAEEFRILASLRHPNIISVLEYGFDAGRQPYFTMELLSTPQTVLEAGAGKPLPTQVALLAQLLRAVAYLHRRGILHRDLKPSEGAIDGKQVLKL